MNLLNLPLLVIIFFIPYKCFGQGSVPRLIADIELSIMFKFPDSKPFETSVGCKTYDLDGKYYFDAPDKIPLLQGFESAFIIEGFRVFWKEKWWEKNEASEFVIQVVFPDQAPLDLPLNELRPISSEHISRGFNIEVLPPDGSDALAIARFEGHTIEFTEEELENWRRGHRDADPIDIFMKLELPPELKMNTDWRSIPLKEFQARLKESQILSPQLEKQH